MQGAPWGQARAATVLHPLHTREGPALGEAPLTPQGQRGMGGRRRPLALGWWLFPKSSGHASACLSQEVPELSRRIATLSTGTLLIACFLTTSLL